MSYCRKFAIFCIHLYQWMLSPWLGMRCRFDPTCSHYAIHAIEAHGIARGGLFTFWRILRCNPFGGTGYDPVPPAPTPPSHAK